jgi:hypothetical protein
MESCKRFKSVSFRINLSDKTRTKAKVGNQCLVYGETEIHK